LKRVLVLVIAVAMLVVLVSPSFGAAPVKVLGGPKNEFYVAKDVGWLAYTQSPATPRGTGRTILYLKADGEQAHRVNVTGTYAFGPSIDVDSALGPVMAFSQQINEDAQTNIMFDYLDIGGSPSGAPNGVNTPKNESAPRIDGNYLLFGRGPRNSSMRQVILYDLTTQDSTVLDQAPYVYPGGIEGDWLTWETCDARCDVYRYQISTQTKTRVRKPNGQHFPYSPVIDANGAVFYLTSGNGCGVQVRLYRALPGAVTSVYSFPRGVDGWLGDVDTSGPDPQLYFARQKCATTNGDIYRIEV
jgi:hypothetical protein